MLREAPINFRPSDDELAILAALVDEAAQIDGPTNRSDILRKLIRAEGRRLAARKQRQNGAGLGTEQ